MKVWRQGYLNLVLSVLSLNLVLSVLSLNLVLSVLSLNLVLSVLSLNLVLSVLSLNLVLSVLSLNLALSVLSLNLVLSVLSLNLVLSVLSLNLALSVLSLNLVPSVLSLNLALSVLSLNLVLSVLSLNLALSLLLTVGWCASDRDRCQTVPQCSRFEKTLLVIKGLRATPAFSAPLFNQAAVFPNGKERELASPEESGNEVKPAAGTHSCVDGRSAFIMLRNQALMRLPPWVPASECEPEPLPHSLEPRWVTLVWPEVFKHHIRAADTAPSRDGRELVQAGSLQLNKNGCRYRFHCRL
ncbi:unnamed protein product [Arctogadus glacialis]